MSKKKKKYHIRYPINFPSIRNAFVSILTSHEKKKEKKKKGKGKRVQQIK
jgi:hypothetical protein